MRVIIAGSRDIHQPLEAVYKAVKASGFHIELVVCGCARGIDKAGEEWSAYTGTEIAYYPADWDKYGKSAGYKRNQLMAENADALIAVWDGKSKGTKHMIDIATKKGLKVYIYEINS